MAKKNDTTDGQAGAQSQLRDSKGVNALRDAKRRKGGAGTVDRAQGRRLREVPQGAPRPRVARGRGGYHLGMSVKGGRDGGSRWALPFLAGVLSAAAGMVVLRALGPRRRLVDPRLIRRAWRGDENVPPAVIVPGIMGSGLLRPDQTRVWLNLRNVVGQYNLSLPFVLPLTESRDELRAGSLLGTEHRLPRMFGFTEYYDLLELLEAAGFVPAKKTGGRGLVHHVFAYDWRRDLVESVRRLDETLEALADARGDHDTRFNIVGHSMGGLIARYYLRYGTAEPQPGMPVTWAGARRINSMVLVAVPNAGSIHSLEAMLYGNRVGLSYTTLAASVIARMPSVYQLIPPKGAAALLDASGAEIDADLHDIATWERFGWGPFGSTSMRRLSGLEDNRDRIGYDEFLAAVLHRAREFHRALVQPPADALSDQGDRARRRLHADDGPLHRAGEAGDVPALRAPEPSGGGCDVRGRRRPRHPQQRAGLAPAGGGGLRDGVRLPRGRARVHRQRRPSRHLQGADLPERAAAPAPSPRRARRRARPRRRGHRLLTGSRERPSPA